MLISEIERKCMCNDQKTWVPAGMGKGGTHMPPSRNVAKCSCVVTSERSVDELFMHDFYCLSSASLPDPTGAPSLDPAGELSFSDP